MKDFIKALSILILPIAFWFCFIATGFGAQSLSQLLELPIVLLASIIIGIWLRKQPLLKILAVIFLFVFLLRCFMPQIPE